LAEANRRFDRHTNKWVDADVNWYTITAFRQLALSAIASVNKGDRIVVYGEVRVRDWDNGEAQGTSVEIEADTIGHDMTYGNSTFTRNVLVKEEEKPDDTYEY
jgi:single-strand DNA-binding protein